jgi:hypothetical protein
VATRFALIQDLRPFDLADFGQCFELENSLFVANKIGSIRGLQSSGFIKHSHCGLWAKWDSTITTDLQTFVKARI